jgi:hypothetical protein
MRASGVRVGKWVEDNTYYYSIQDNPAGQRLWVEICKKSRTVPSPVLSARK